MSGRQGGGNILPTQRSDGEFPFEYFIFCLFVLDHTLALLHALQPLISCSKEYREGRIHKRMSGDRHHVKPLAARVWFVVSLLGLMMLLFVSDGEFARSQNDCGGNCPWTTCPGNHCPCGVAPRQLSPTQVGTFCARFPEWSAACCECIVSKESGGNANAVGYDILFQNFRAGLLQIPDMFWGKCNSGWPPCSTEATLTCAIENWKLGNGTWALWDYTCPLCGSCCRSP